MKQSNASRCVGTLGYVSGIVGVLVGIAYSMYPKLGPWPCIGALTMSSLAFAIRYDLLIWENMTDEELERYREKARRLR